MGPSLPPLLGPSLCESLMREALAEARIGLGEGECPIGCVLARMDDRTPRIVARGHNRVKALGRKTAHAEMVAFENAGMALDGASEIVLVSTLEPCVMCSGACFEVGVSLVVFGLRAPADSGTRRVKPPSSPETRAPTLVGDVLAADSRSLFVEYVRGREGSREVAYAEQLLSLT